MVQGGGGGLISEVPLYVIPSGGGHGIVFANPGRLGGPSPELLHIGPILRAIFPSGEPIQEPVLTRCTASLTSQRSDVVASPREISHYVIGETLSAVRAQDSARGHPLMGDRGLPANSPRCRFLAISRI